MNGAFGKIIDAARGRTTLFISFFVVAGHVMAWFHRLTPEYTLYMATILTAVLGHKISCDWFAAPTPTTTTTQVETPGAIATQQTTSTPAKTPAPG
jgi:hypothetical protein